MMFAGRTVRRASRGAVTALFALIAMSCAAPPAQENGALQIGDEGPEVAEVHAFLSSYGYLPNDALAEAYPMWRPAVLERTLSPEVFDETLERAVIAYQRFNHLPQTGVVDDETRALMDTPRCGVPDNLGVRYAGDEKFDLLDLGWGGNCMRLLGDHQWELTYSIEIIGNAAWATLGLPASFTQDQFRTDILYALGAWEAKTSFKFREVSSNACIRFRVPSIDPCPIPGSLACNANTYVKETKTMLYNDVRFETGVAWGAVPGAVPAGSVDLLRAMIHEIGHALLLGHSSVFAGGVRPMMHPIEGPANNYTLSADDLMSAHVSSNAINPLVGGVSQQASSIDVAHDGAVWITTRTTTAGGYTIKGFTTRWNTISGGATQVAVTSSGIAWVINDKGEIFRRTGTSGRYLDITKGSWQLMTGQTAARIAANGGQVYILGLTVRSGTRDRYIYRFNTATSGWDRIDGLATELTVDVGGRPWVINEAGQLFVRNAAGSGWDQVTTPDGPNTWKKVRAGKDGAILAITNNDLPYVWNYQDALAEGATARRRWLYWRYEANAPLDFVSDPQSVVWSISHTAPGGPDPVAYYTVGRSD